MSSPPRKITVLSYRPSNSSYEVLDEARNVVGHIMLSDAAPPEMPWIWGISSGHHAGRKPTYGYEATCEAAMEAFARVWHRE
jgi:hypothetical protein